MLQFILTPLVNTEKNGKFVHKIFIFFDVNRLTNSCLYLPGN